MLPLLEADSSVDKLDVYSPPHPLHFHQLFEVDVLLMGYINFLGPRVQDSKFVRPCPRFLILMLGKHSLFDNIQCRPI